MDKLVLRPNEAAKVASVSRTIVFAAIKRGHLKASKLGRSTLIRVCDLHDWLETLPKRRVA